MDGPAAPAGVPGDPDVRTTEAGKIQFILRVTTATQSRTFALIRE
ncbi:hypothetical protein [Arthrobacter sp. ISL-28]|nr:hypothetical protein [Arthrobacter sp. ISL-28]